MKQVEFYVKRYDKAEHQPYAEKIVIKVDNIEVVWNAD